MYFFSLEALYPCAYTYLGTVDVERSALMLPGRHLSFTYLADLAEERVVADPDTEQHLATCERCKADLQWLRETIRHLQGTELVAPPPATTAQIKALFRQYRPARQRLVLGDLSFDSMFHTPAFALRSSLALERQMLIQFLSTTLDLRVRPDSAGWAVVGQVLVADGSMPEHGRIELLGIRGRASAVLNPLGEFQLPALPSGSYRLTVLFTDQILVFPQIDLGS